ncbi:hypothetical protein HYALB_00013351 [Hymenoscyphus albidus]|uniref:Orotidine 5'-phosphate decarboxylase n=1 Tax=Hymenoscyphus albidus TaxID=595503 RepID=A0A9N9QBF3_9HELO|nr:hypothetical protein HYALB_00013351 [Hymenoscyphus albidus]
MSSRPPHPITTTPFSTRATTTPHPLSTYLLRLMTLKKTNLCLSADVSTTNQLLALANALGPSICVLKTHYDLISNWDYNPTTGTGARLARLARRHGFLIFEDRKFGDIGNTVQLQYTEGTAKIIEWSHITNVNMVPGKAAVDALAEAAVRWRERKRYEVKTDISVGTPRAESINSDNEEEEDKTITPIPEYQTLELGQAAAAGRKASIVSITTVSQHFEPVNSPRSYSLEFGDEALEGIEEAPLERGLLILAQMSSQGNFMNAEYTAACVEAAREHPNYVMGFVAQESLNEKESDHFLNMTPGCQLPPEEEDEDALVVGDGKGQQYNTPAKIIGLGNDIVIVGRGIIFSADPVEEAERYRRKAWEAYEERVGATNGIAT